MKKKLQNMSRAEIAGIFVLMAAFAAFFIHPLLSASVVFSYIALCVGVCFFPGTNFFGQVISRGNTGENNVALTFDDGPSEFTTVKILDLLDRHSVKATFFVAGVNAARFPDLIHEIIRRGHSIGNHSYSHDPFVMMKSYPTLFYEVDEARRVLQKMGIDALAFRPPVGIINPKLPSILRRLGLFCVTFSCRARDAGNRRVKNMAARILEKVKGDDIILLHDKPPLRPEDATVLWLEFEKILKGIVDRKLRIVPLSELIGKKLMNLELRK